MRILRIIARLNVGGPARNVVWLSRDLNDQEYQTLLLAGSIPEGEDDMSFFAAEHGVTPVYIEEMSREISLKDIAAFVKIYGHIRRFRPDIIHTHTAKAGTLGRLAALIYRLMTWGTLIGRPRRLGVVHTFHGHIFHGYYGRLKTAFYLLIERFLARFATDRVVVLSDQQLNEINGKYKVGDRSIFRIVPLGIDLDAAAAARDNRPSALRGLVNARPGESIVGLVGRLTNVKNVPLFLEAVAMLDRSDDNIPLRYVIAGDGDLRPELEDLARSLNLHGVVTFLGSRPDSLEIMADLDVLALTSVNEGTPLSLIEAMALRVPVVATEVGGVIDLLGETIETRENFRICRRGIGVTSGSARSVYEGIRYILASPDMRDEIVETAARYVQSRYSVDRLTTDIKELYRELIVNADA